MTESEKLGELYKQAQSAFGSRDWAAVIGLLTQVTSRNPDYPGAQKMLREAQKRRDAHIEYTIGLGYFDEKKWPQAIGRFRSTLRRDPGHSDAQARLEEAKRQARIGGLLSKADQYRRHSKWERVVLKLREAAELDPDSEEIRRQVEDAEAKHLYQTAEWHLRSKHWQSASESFNKLEKLRPGYDDVPQKLKEIEKQLAVKESSKGDQRSFSIRWFLLGVIVAAVIILFFRRQLHCLLCYRLTEVICAILLGLGGVLLVGFAKLVPPDKREILNFSAYGVGTALFCSVILALFLPEPSREECFPTSAVTLTPTVQTATSTPTYTATLTPSLTHTPAATAVPVVATTTSPTPTPSLTPTPTSSPSPTPTLTAMPTLAATDTSMPTAISTKSSTTLVPTTPLSIYPPPVLGFVGTVCNNVTLRWQWPRTLADNESFAVRVGKLPDIPHSQVWVKERQYVYTLLSESGDYVWEVAICRGDPSKGHCSNIDGTELTVSERQTFSFVYDPNCTPPP